MLPRYSIHAKATFPGKSPGLCAYWRRHNKRDMDAALRLSADSPETYYAPSRDDVRTGSSQGSDRVATRCAPGRGVVRMESSPGARRVGMRCGSIEQKLEGPFRIAESAERVMRFLSTDNRGVGATRP